MSHWLLFLNLADMFLYESLQLSRLISSISTVFFGEVSPETKYIWLRFSPSSSASTCMMAVLAFPFSGAAWTATFNRSACTPTMPSAEHQLRSEIE